MHGPRCTCSAVYPHIVLNFTSVALRATLGLTNFLPFSINTYLIENRVSILVVVNIHYLSSAEEIYVHGYDIAFEFVNNDGVTKL